MVQISENLYLWRNFRGLSQAKLAKLSGVPRPNLSAIERGKREASLLTLKFLSYTLKTKAGELIDGTLPFKFNTSALSRQTLEKIAAISLGDIPKRCSPSSRSVGIMLLKVTENRINAEKRVYKKTLRNHKPSIDNWLMFKASVGIEVINNLLSRQENVLMRTAQRWE